MEMVTKRDMEDAKGLGERSGLNMSDDWEYFIHDVAQSIADGRRSVIDAPATIAELDTILNSESDDQEITIHPDGSITPKGGHQ